jgi:hypothetical protein
MARGAAEACLNFKHAGNTRKIPALYGVYRQFRVSLDSEQATLYLG